VRIFLNIILLYLFASVLLNAAETGTFDEFETLNDVYFVDALNGWAVGNLSTILHTTDGGSTWVQQDAPLEATLQAVHFSDLNNGVAVGGINCEAAKDLLGWNYVVYDPNYAFGIILKTSDGGKTWELITNVSTTKPSAGEAHFYGWLFDVSFSDVLTGWAVGESGMILKTIDGGISWQQLNTGTNRITSEWLYSAHFIDANRGWVGSENRGLIHTSDGGETWVKQIAEIEELPRSSYYSYFVISEYIAWRGIYFLNDGLHGWAVAENATIIRTTNGGASWDTLASSFSDKVKNCVDLKDVYFVDENNGWVVGQMGKRILHTTDGGATWGKQTLLDAEWLYGVHFINETTGYAVGDFGTIAVTNDKGATWNYQRHMEKYANTRAPFLITHAHGDDETLYMTPPATRYAYQEKLPSVSLRVTRDDRNTNRIGEIKGLEKQWSSNYLGINTNRTFDETDTDAEESLDYKITLWEGEKKVQRQIVDVIRTWKPLVITTHEPTFGEYKKSGHMATGYYTALAFQSAGQADKFPELTEELGLEPWQPQKLYFIAGGDNPATMTEYGDGNQGSKALHCYISQGMTDNSVSSSRAYYREFSTITPAPDDNNGQFDGVVLNGNPAPLAPSSLSAISASGSAVALTWTDNSDNETQFKIERSHNGNDSWVIIGTGSANENTYTDNGLYCETMYYYRVFASSASSNSSYSNIDSTTTDSCVGCDSTAITAYMQINDGTLQQTNADSLDLGDKVRFSPQPDTGYWNWSGPNKFSASTREVVISLFNYNQDGIYTATLINECGVASNQTFIIAIRKAATPAPPDSLLTSAVSGSSINLVWNDNSVNEAQFKIERSPDGSIEWTQIGATNANDTVYSDTELTCGTKYYRVRAFNEGGYSEYSNIANATTDSCGSSLPSEWENKDIGNPMTGDATYDNVVFTIYGDGEDIYGRSDNFHYVYQTLNGDGEIEARVTSLENTNGWAKAGVMIRERFTSNSKNFAMVMTAENGTNAQWRKGSGSSTSNVYDVDNFSPPYWVKIVRDGTTFIGYNSSDGLDWTQVGSTTISMETSVYVGLCVTSHNGTTLCTASFDNVSLNLITSVNELGTAKLPEQFALFPAYPNPFNPETIIRFDLPEELSVRLSVYNSLGQLVSTLIADEQMNRGSYQYIWNGRNDFDQKLSSGMYLIVIRTGEYKSVKKVTLLK